MQMKTTKGQKLQRAITPKNPLNWSKIKSGDLIFSPNQYIK